MHIYTRLTYDDSQNRASLTFSTDPDFTTPEDEVTVYQYDSGQVTVDDLAETELPAAEYIDIMADIRQWVENIEGRWRPDRWPRSDYEFEFKRNDGGCEFKFETEDFTSEAEWDDGSGEIVFQARDGFTVSWADFHNWYLRLREMAEDIQYYDG